MDSSGNVYIADFGNNEIEKLTAGGVLSIFAGTGTVGTPTPGVATSSMLNGPQAVGADSLGNVYIADSQNQVVEKVNTTGVLSIFAGTGTVGTPTPGPATSSAFNFPVGVTLDSFGNVYITDNVNSVIDEVGGVATRVFTADTPMLSATGGAGYSYTFTASGNPAPTFAISAGSLPTGLSSNATTGVLSGTPTTAGTFSFTVTATNIAGTVSSGSLTINVYATGGAPGMVETGGATAATPGGAG